MFQQYFKFIIRKLSRNRVYTVINIVGLSIAFSAAWLIYSHTSNEWNMDGYLKNGDHIYRVINRNFNEPNWNCRNNSFFGLDAQQALPEIDRIARFFLKDYQIKTDDNTDFMIESRCALVDLSFFDLFERPVIQGNIDSSDFSWIVLTETSAKRFFDKENPIGKTITIKDPIYNRKKEVKCQVIAIIKDFPANSTLQTDIFIDCRLGHPYFSNERYSRSVYTYFRLSPRTDLERVEKALQEITLQRTETATHCSYRLQPLKDTYFHSDHIEQDELLRGSLSLTYLLWGITLLILLLAAGNFLLIRIAQQNRDSSRFAIHKCYGASNTHLLYQLISEIGLLTGVTLVLAFILTSLLHPYIIQVLSPDHVYPFLFFSFSNLLFVVFTCCIMGSICYFLYFHFKQRINRLGVKNILQPGPRQINLSQILTILQIGIFTTLLFYCSIIISQIHFIKDKPLGIITDQVLRISWLDNSSNYQALKEELLKHPDILYVCNGINIPDPGTPLTERIHFPSESEKYVDVVCMYGDEDFTNIYNIPIIKNQEFTPIEFNPTPENNYSSTTDVWVNKKFVETFKLDHPLGTILNQQRSVHYRITGITEDYHTQSLHYPIRPTMILPPSTYWLLIRYQPGKRQEVLEYLQELHRSRNPEGIFEYQEYNYSDLYQKDMAFMELVILFSLIAILIGGMGIFAFAIFMVESKTREIALRKVNGASERQIMLLFNRQFMTKVLVACVIGLPIAYYASRKWLENYAYRIEIQPWIFVLTIVISLCIVLLVTNWQIRQASRKNPIDTLKTE